MPAIGSSYVNVSFNPVSAIGGDTFPDSNAQTPRFIATSGDPIMVLQIDDCTTTLLFPFVTNQAAFDTGLVISNTSEEAGSCTIELQRFRGHAREDAQTADLMAGPVEGRRAMDSLLCQALRTWIPGLLSRQPVHFGMRLALPSSANGFGAAETTAGARAISLYARRELPATIRTNKKGHRVAAPAREEIALRTRLKTIGESGPRSGFPYFFIRPELSHCRPWPAAC